MGELMDSTLEENFAERVTVLFSKLLPGGVVSLDEIQQSTGHYQLAHTLPEEEGVVQFAMGRLKQTFMQSPVHQYMAGEGQEKVLTLRELAPTAELERTDFYQDVFRPLGLKHQIVVRLDRPGWRCSLTLNHEKAFPAELRPFLENIMSPLVAAHRIACEVRRLRSRVGEPAERIMHAKLTPREHEVLSWMREGKRNADIAEILKCAVRTVEKHVESILRKTGTESRSAAIGFLDR